MSTVPCAKRHGSTLCSHPGGEHVDGPNADECYCGCSYFRPPAAEPVSVTIADDDWAECGNGDDPDEPEWHPADRLATTIKLNGVELVVTAIEVRDGKRGQNSPGWEADYDRLVDLQDPDRLSAVERLSWEPHEFLNDYGDVQAWSGRKTHTRIIVDTVAKVVIDRLEADLARARELLGCLADDEECRFDHHGGCQAHGFLSLQPGEMCPNAEARRLLGG